MCDIFTENFELKKGELTRKGFMDLNQMEANDVEGDTDDLWVTLHSMGFNNRLELDQVRISHLFSFFSSLQILQTVKSE